MQLFALSLAFHHSCVSRVPTSHGAGMGENSEHSKSATPNSPPARGSLLLEILHHSCAAGVLQWQHIYYKIGQTFCYTLGFAFCVGALQIALFEAALTGNVALIMMQKKRCLFLFSECWCCFSCFTSLPHVINLEDQR